MKQTASSKHLVAQIFLIAGSARRWFFTAGAVMGLALPLAIAATPVMAQTGNGPPLVAAAANMQSALGELVPLFQRSSGGKVSLSIGSSANLVRQIQQGLPAELFLSADEDFALRLADAGLTTDRGVVYATGRIVLVAPKDSALKLDPQLAGLKDALTAQPNSVEKFAIANPELAPYGKAAIQALEKQGILPLVQPKLVIGENIAQTTQFISSGAAPAGITALALVLAPAVADRVRYALVASALHTPIRQRMVLLKTASPSARAFYEFLQSPAAKVVLKRYGYE